MSAAETPGTPIPSIRDLARDHKVSVITVQRAYDDLVREGLIIARRGKGYFVADLAKSEKSTRFRTRFMEALGKYLIEAMQMTT